MSVEIRVPQLGESIVEATIVRWLKQEGTPIREGDELVELETDKANIPVVSTASGVLERIVKKDGETVGINEVLATVSEQGAATAAPAAETRPAAEVLPTAEASAESQAASDNGRTRVLASPVASQMAAENGVELARIPGSGPGGKVVKEDVENYLRRTAQAVPEAAVPAHSAAEAVPTRTAAPSPGEAAPVRSAPPPPTVPSAEPVRAQARPTPPTAPAGREERLPMSRMRQTIARRLVEAQHNAAMLTTFNEVDMSAVNDVRKRRKEAFREKHGVGLGYMSFFTKAAIGALKAFPLLNAEIQGDETVVKRYYDIGIAVSVKDGLVVPVVRSADSKSFAEIEREIADLATRARDRKLMPAELMGGTFTITNGGVFGSLMSTPILNAPQVGILGMHKIQERPVAANGEVVIRPMMYLALSYDHRIVDGSEAVRFLVRVKELIEDPETLLLEG